MKNFNFNEDNKALISKKEINNNLKLINDEIININLLPIYNSYINYINDKDKDDLSKINISKIFSFFIKNYSNNRHNAYLLKKENIFLKVKNNKFNKLYLYHYALFYIFIFLNKNKFELDQKKTFFDNNTLISIDKYFKFLKLLFISRLITDDELIHILQLFLFHINNKNNNEKELGINKKVNILITCLKFTKKVIKFETTNNILFIDKIFKEIIIKIVNIINDKNNKDYLSIINNFRKDKSIFSLLKLLNENYECINVECKKIIEENIEKFLVNNFRKEHLNYFYKNIGKLLIKFNNLKKNEDFSLLLKKDFLFLSKINNILVKTINKEKEQFNNEENRYYCDKGFIFNNKDKSKYGITIKNIDNNFNKKTDHNFCMLFTFLIKEINNNNEILNVILSLLDDNKELLSIYIKGKNLYLRYFSKYLIELKILENIKINHYYSLFIFYDKKEIKISLNNEDKIANKESKFELPKEFNISVGFIEENNYRQQISSFNGIICPIILFYIKDGKSKKDNIFKEIKELLFGIKNYYYLIGEECSPNDDYNTLLSYYGLCADLNNKNRVLEIYNKIKNFILYIDPNVIINSFNKKTKIFKEERAYNDSPEAKYKPILYTYEFTEIPNLENNFIYPFKDNNIISFLKLNNGMNYLILQIEIMYNFILLMKNNNNTNDVGYNNDDFDLM